MCVLGDTNEKVDVWEFRLMNKQIYINWGSSFRLQFIHYDYSWWGRKHYVIIYKTIYRTEYYW